MPVQARNNKEMLQMISRNEEKLPATMTDTQQELFFRYTDCVKKIPAWCQNHISCHRQKLSPDA